MRAQRVSRLRVVPLAFLNLSRTCRGFTFFFKANPPFVEEVMERMVDKMHDLLERATGPMSFAVIVPGWDDEGCVSYQNMKRSRFARPQPGLRTFLLSCL